MAGQEIGRGKFPTFLILAQGLLLILFVVFIEYDSEVLPNAKHPGKIDSKYPGLYCEIMAINLMSNRALSVLIVLFLVFQDVHTLVLVGFGLIMTFLKRYGFSGLGYNFLISAVTTQWATIMQGFFEIQENNKIRIGIDSIIKGDLASMTILITFGVILGKTSHLQLLVLAFFEVIFYVGNRNICTKYLKASDPGGSIFNHLFGACFGLAIARILYNKKAVAHDKETSSYTSDIFATIGTIFLWVYWPSLNAVLLEGTLRHRAIINTYYAMAASCVTAYAFSSFVTKDSKLSMVHVQNATLAGGVAVGTISGMIIQLWGAILIGLVGGVVSTIGYKYVQPLLIRKLHVHDTCGVISLHGLPGIVAALASTISAGMARYKQYNTSLYLIFPARAPVLNSTRYFELAKMAVDMPSGLARSAGQQAGFQFAAFSLTLVVSIIAGLLTGIIVRHQFFDPLSEEELYEDQHFWEVPLDNTCVPDDIPLTPQTPLDSFTPSPALDHVTAGDTIIL